MTKTSEECRGPWRAGPWYPGFHCADSGPWQGAASLKLKSHRPAWAVVGAAEVRGAAHGDVRRAGILFITEMARPGASLAWCSFIDCFMHENGDSVADVIPCALCRGGRDSFARKEPSRGLGASRSSAWSLAESKATPLGCPLEERSLARRNPSRGSPGLESLSLAESEAASLVSSRGEVPREGRQAWRAWSLAKSSEECRGPWQAGPWYPGFHCTDSSPRAHDGHAEVVDEGEASRGQQSLPGP